VSACRRHAEILAVIVPAAALAAVEPPPNVVLIYADDLGYGDLGCFGAKGIRTPNLDRMAAEGVRFTNFHVAQAVCSASRAALLTGCYSNRIGIHGALGPKAEHGIHEDETTIAEVLKTRGYATAVFGKWHLGHHPQFLPSRHGFDEYYGLPYSNDMWPRHPSNAADYPPLPLIEGEKTIALDPDQSRLTGAYTERAVSFIERRREQPFFLYLAHSMPHVPLFASERFRGKSARGLYGDVIEEIDHSTGEVLAALKRHGIDSKTLVIFTSDNGPWLSYGDHAGSAGPLREGKGTSWEGGVRVPFIARWPGTLPAGATMGEPAMTIDLLPTFAKLAGAELPKRPIDGKDIGALLRAEPGARCPHDAYWIYFHQGELQALIAGPWKLILPQRYRSLEGRPGGKDGKPAAYGEKRIEASELYHLESDPGEARNLAAQHPELVKRLEGLVDEAREDLGDAATGRAGKGVREPGRVTKP
jgi:arylsulfatase A-like enzyme